MALSYSSVDVMTVRDMIDAAIVFKNCDPTIEFKMLETILYILGRHLNVLERQVQIKMSKLKRKIKKSIAVTEVKVHTRKKSKSRSSTEKSATDKSSDLKSSDKSSSSKPGPKSSRKPSSGDSSTDVKKKRHRSKSRAREKSRSRSHSKGHGRNYTAYAVKEKTGKQGRKYKTRWTEEDERADVIHEKLLIVSRTPSDSDINFHRGSVVTEDQFNKLVAEVRKLQAKYGVQDMFAESEKPWMNLHKPTSLTDPKAALNMSARLNTVEANLTQMLEVITKFARKVPGINIDKLFEGTLTGAIGTTGPAQEEEMFITEELLATETEVEAEPEEDKNWATWKQLTAGLDDIRGDIIPYMSRAANNAASVAKCATKLFKQAEPKLNEAHLLNIKFVKLKFLSERFVNKVTELDTDLTKQMGECQEGLSQMQFNVDVTLERLEDMLAHPKEDPNAVNAIKEDFTNFQYLLVNTKQSQLELKNLHKHNSIGLDLLRKKIEALRIEKITRDEVAESLKDKASINDLNDMLSRDQYHAVTGFIQQVIHTTNERINSGEFEWQKCIDDYISELYEKANYEQLETLNHSLSMYTSSMNITVNKMLEIVGPYPVTSFEKKLDRDGNCLCCGNPANVILSDKCMEVAKEMMTRPVSKPPAIDDTEIQKPCVPGRPIPHPLDLRGLVCKRFCGASVCKSEESLPSSFGIDVIDINPGHTLDMHSKVYLRDLNICCTPCTHSEDTLLK